MPAWLSSFVARLRSSSSATDNSLAVFGPGNAIAAHTRHLKRLRKQVDPLAAARRDAVAPERNTGADGRLRYEHDAVVAFQREMDRLKSGFERRMRDVDTRIKRVASIPDFDEQSILYGVFEKEKATFRAWRDRLLRAKLGTLQNKRYMNAFRRKHSILRDVERPTTWVALAGIVALAAFEMFLNFNYLVPTGIQAASEILVFVFSTALINVALGIASGYFGIRYVHHRLPLLKTLGIVLTIIFLSAALLLHCTLANYRHAIDMATSNQSDPELLAKALQQVGVGISSDFWHNLFGFVGDVNAMIVFCYGVIFNLIVMWEGASLLDDTYPGLGKRDRAWRRAGARSEAAEKTFRDEIGTIISDAKGTIDATTAEANKRLQVIKGCVDDAARLAKRFEEGANIIESTLMRMISDYWTEFKAVRETKGIPEWTDDVPRLDREISFEMDSLIQIEEKETAKFQGLSDKGEQIKTRLTAEQAALMSRVSDYFEAVETESVRDEEMLLAELIGVHEPMTAG